MHARLHAQNDTHLPLLSIIRRLLLTWTMVCVGTSCSSGEDGHIRADFWNQSGTRQTLSGESECRPIAK